MPKITLVGDVHGKIDQYLTLLECREEPVIQLGDMGCGFTHIPHFETNKFFIRGNHDDPKVAREHKNYLGDFGYLPNYDLFYLGGAFSVDFHYRQYLNYLDLARGGTKKCWWVDEELSMAELNEAVQLYKESKPKIVVSHECPAKAGLMLLQLMQERLFKGACSESRTAQALQIMFESHRPELWVFGHYHFSKSFDLDGTKFVCLNELESKTIDTEVPLEQFQPNPIE